jgi:hypothetical protein
MTDVTILFNMVETFIRGGGYAESLLCAYSAVLQILPWSQTLRSLNSVAQFTWATSLVCAIQLQYIYNNKLTVHVIENN